MNFPIAERELRVAARSPRTYRARLIACLVFGAVTGWIFWFATQIGPFSTIAPRAYAFMAHLALLMCMFSSLVTSDSLSSEKRNGTLGLLFLTDLRGVDIVFGKLAALGLVSFYGLMAAVPVLAMPLLMGGVSGQSVFRTIINLLNALFFALAMGLWISARSWDQKRAANGGIWMVIMFMWIFPFMAEALRRRPAFVAIADWLYVLSPTYQQEHATPFGIGMTTEKYWTSVAITHVLAWLALWRTCAILPHAWQDRAMVPAVGRLKKFWQELRFGSPELRRDLRDRLLRINAVHWLSARERFAPINAWLFVIAVVLGWVGLWGWVKIYVTNGPPFWAIGIPATMILYLGLRVRACGLAGEVIARDRISGALELLLSTTMTERDVAYGQLRTFLRTLLGPAIAGVAIGSSLFVAALFEVLRRGSARDLDHAWMVFLALMILFVCDLVASFWTGMWAACFSRNVAATAGQAVLRLLVLPWAIFMISMTTGVTLRIGNNLEFIDVFGGWWTLCMTNNIFWAVHSRQNFYQRLRAAAAERYQPRVKRRFWERILPNSARVQRIGLSKMA
jgi:ABC-type Na+ efflux pump permease subunit